MCFLFPLYRRWIKTDTAVTYVKECCSMFSSKNFIESGLAFRFLIRFELFLCMVLVQLVSHVRLFVTPWTAAHQASLCITISQSLFRLMAIQPSRPLSSPSSPALNLSQYQSLFQWVGSSHQVAKVLELQLQHQPFQWTFRVDFL